MFEQFEQIEHYFDVFVRACILLIEIAGIAVIVISMVRGFIGYVRKDESIRIDLAKGIMLGLEFKVGSEVLRSVIVSGWNELGTLAAVILLRSLLTFLLHWEIREEEKRCEALPGTSPLDPSFSLISCGQKETSVPSAKEPKE